ncbi:hypothetical protein ALI144C_31210 [Actinosynnema sp. ALI-1.44]|nr:hypothetical protein ALI144C_31210 [Actinosynnema sp. ALI-1.44]
MTPSAPKLRQVLALLTLQANKIVRNEKFIEELWEDNPPASVTTTLQTYVYQLRKLLNLDKSGAGRGGEWEAQPALSTSFGGYMLSIDPQALDVHCFEALAERGRRDLEAGQVADAARTLAKAVGLWRGQALVDVSCGPILSAETLRLDELRKCTLERRIEADLRLGRHQELMGELTGLVAEHPTHEGFQGKLILALYRSGRRSEALYAYQRMRTVLARELGLDPAGELQRLHRAVLTSDRCLDLPAGVGAVYGEPRQEPPCQLPPKGGVLIGREDAMREVLDGLSPVGLGSPAVVVVTGPPGSGKSALCTHAAYRARARYPDGQLYTRLPTNGEPVDCGAVLAGFLRALGVSERRLPSSVEELRLMFRSHTADRRALVVVDDVTSADQLAMVLPGGEGNGVLASSRRRLSDPGVGTVVELGALAVEEGVQLLIGTVGQQRVLADRDAAAALVRACDGMPSALQAVASKLRARPHWRLGRALRLIADELSGDGTRRADPMNLRTPVEATYRSMSPQAQAAFRVFASVDVATLSVKTVSTILGTDERSAESLLEDLTEAHLIVPCGEENGGDFTYRCLPTLRVTARQLFAPPEVRVPPQADSSSRERIDQPSIHGLRVVQ